MFLICKHSNFYFDWNGKWRHLSGTSSYIFLVFYLLTSKEDRKVIYIFPFYFQFKPYLHILYLHQREDRKVIYFPFIFSSNRTYIIKPTDLRMNENYQYYYISWARAILLAFIPFLLLLILNGKIIINLRKVENIPLSRVSILHLFS